MGTVGMLSPSKVDLFFFFFKVGLNLSVYARLPKGAC